MASGFFVFTRVHPKEGQEHLVSAIIREVLSPTRLEAGCLAIDGFASTQTQVFYINSHWEDEAAFERHLNLPHTLKFLADIKASIDRPLEVTRSRPL